MSDFDKNKIWLYSIVNTTVIITTVVKAVVVSFIWHFDFQFFSFLSKWAFARHSYRSEYLPASCHLNAINIRFDGIS